MLQHIASSRRNWPAFQSAHCRQDSPRLQQPLTCSHSDHCQDQGRREHQQITRRDTLLGAVVLLTGASSGSADAIGFKKELKKKKVSVDEYATDSRGLKYYDIAVGTGEEVTEGKKVKVHFDCNFKGIDVVSTRSARLLGGNRSISEPYDFIAGEPVATTRAKKINDAANGLFAGAGGPQPPPALSSSVIGMKNGGKRLVVVPPEQGFGAKGMLEIPANATFELQIEVLDVNRA